MKRIWRTIMYILSLQWVNDSKRESVDAGICDYSGQGRDKYGK